MICNKKHSYICNYLTTQKTGLHHYNITYTLLVSFFCNIFVIKKNLTITGGV